MTAGLERTAPTSEQAAAIEARDRDVLLEAGAGTGKTRVLVDRYCEAAEQGAGIESILAFTFTERAAAELRARITSELSSRAERARSAGEEARARELFELAGAGEAAWVSTIHGFCRRLIAAHPLALGLDPRFRVLDEAEARRIAARAFELALEQALEDDRGELATLASATKAPELRRMIAAAYAELRSQGREPRLAEPTLRDRREVLTELRDAAVEACREVGTAGRQNRERLAAAAALDPDKPLDESGLAALELGKSTGAAFSGDACMRYRVRCRAARSALAEGGGITAYRRFGELLEMFAARYEELKAERSGLDFEDLQLQACRLLAEQPAIAGAYRDRFAHIMVDEFQDTNRLQLQLVELLRGPKTIVFKVGDEFQSIYGFRHADVEAFRAERDAASRGEGGAGLLGLRGNFRSAPAVVGAVNFLAESILDGFEPLTVARDPDHVSGGERGVAAGPELAGSPAAGPDARPTPKADGQLSLLGEPPRLDEPAPAPAGRGAQAGRPAGAEEVPAGEPGSFPEGPPDGVELLLTPAGNAWKSDEIALESELPGDYPSPPDRVAEARFLAHRLRELVDEGLERGRIVVLMRAFTHIAAVEDELELAGLRPYVVGGRGFWSQQQVDDVQRLLNVIANPLDDESLYSVLSSPACAVSPSTLWLLARARRESGSAHLWPVLHRGFGPGKHAEPDDGSEPRSGAGQVGATGHGGREDPGEAAARLEAIEARDAERLSRLCVQLEQLRRGAPLVTLEELIDRAVTVTGYDLAVLAMSRGRRRWANVRKLMRLAREFEAAEGRDLRGFCDHLAESSDAGREGEAATEAEDHDGVRVMTVHAAKGLEFDTVAVADLGRGLLAGGRPPGVRVERKPPDPGSSPRVGIRLTRFGAKAIGVFGYDELTEQAAEAESQEACRLAYVAATRAQRRLILSGSYVSARLAKDDDGALPASTPVTERLVRAMRLGPEPTEGEFELAPPSPRPGLEASFASSGIRIRINRPEEAAFQALKTSRGPVAERPARPAEIAPAPAIAARPESAPRAALHLSPSSLAGFERCGYRFFTERVLGLAARESSEGTAGDPRRGSARGFGNAVHELLERSARLGWREPEAGEVAAALRRHGGGSGDTPLERARAMVAGWLGSELRHELGEAAAQTEVPFLLEVSGSLVRGTIDLLADAGGPLVVDYKTDRVGKADPADLADRYGLQREIYALAAARGAPRGVRTAYVFLERPDEPILAELGPDELEHARGRLRGATGRIAAGSYEVTDNPHRALCHDCPARRTLCTHTEIPDRPRVAA